MHQLANEFGIAVWHGHELLKKMLTAKAVTVDRVKEIYDALDANDDLPRTWREAKHESLKKVFRPG
jgi:hypothetical protein